MDLFDRSKKTYFSYKEPPDIPKNVADELARLHELLNLKSDENREWARKRIDQIHALYFSGHVEVVES